MYVHKQDLISDPMKQTRGKENLTHTQKSKNYAPGVLFEVQAGAQEIQTALLSAYQL